MLSVKSGLFSCRIARFRRTSRLEIKLLSMAPLKIELKTMEGTASIFCVCVCVVPRGRHQIAGKITMEKYGAQCRPATTIATGHNPITSTQMYNVCIYLTVGQTVLYGLGMCRYGFLPVYFLLLCVAAAIAGERERASEFSYCRVWHGMVWHGMANRPTW